MSKSKSDANAMIAIVMIIVCILVVTVLITGCDIVAVRDEAIDIYATSENTSELESQTYTTYNNPVNTSSEIKYLVPNALDEVKTEKSPIFDPTRNIVGKDHDIIYPTYLGLKSQAVQDKVNAQVTSLIIEIGGLLNPETVAPFRGIKTIIDETSTLSYSFIYISTVFNANNLLCVQGSGSGTYKASGTTDKEPTWVRLTRGLTLDLNTGESVPLEALFIDGYDFKSAINDEIMEQIAHNNLMEETYIEFSELDYIPYRLSKPFDGIAHNQAYLLSEYGITIIINENDPRFVSGFEQITFTIDFEKFGDNLAIDKRYFNPEENLFVDETEKRMLPVWKTNVYGHSEFYEGTFEGGKWFLTAHGLDDRFVDVYETVIIETKAYLNGLIFEGQDNNVHFDLGKMPIGRFTNISKEMWVSKGNEYIGSIVCQLYDESGKLLTLDDLFVEGFDFETLLKSRVHEHILRSGNYKEAEIENAYATKSFSLNQSNLVIYLTLPDRGIGNYMLQVNIPFEDFGVRNMTIFD